MLTEERQDEIVKIVDASGAISVQELVNFLDISESTVRRDLFALDKQGRIKRVHGGATAVKESAYEADMENLRDKYSFHMLDKRRIAQFAATKVKKNDFVYLDSGSTVEQMAEFLTGSEATFVTNSIPLAQKLGRNDVKVYILPGRVKGKTEAIIGSEMRDMLSRYHLPKAFLVPMALMSEPDARRRMMKKPFASGQLSGSARRHIFWLTAASLVYLPILPLLI